MKIINNLLLAIGMLVGAGTMSAAHASVISDSVAFDDIFITTTNSYTYTHNIFEDGFVPGTLLSPGGSVTIHLTDNNGNEAYLVSIGLGAQTFTGSNVNSGQGNFPMITLLSTSLADLQSDGLLSVTVSSTSGSFFLSGSELNVATAVPGGPPPSNVPEPLTMALLGIGLAGIGIARRKTSKATDGK